MFFYEVVELAREHGWGSYDHFSVDKRLIEARALLKSFGREGEDRGPGSGNAWTDFNW